ncbi:MAG: hypothetical protein KIT40_16285 [Nitrospira sp.]|nr:hypothetical protein [Nitrospira sp.]
MLVVPQPLVTRARARDGLRLFALHPAIEADALAARPHVRILARVDGWM